MIKFSFLGDQYQATRIVGHFNPNHSNAIVVFLGAIHGNALYFVANGKGGHTFSDSLEQHQRAVDKLIGKD